MNNIRPFIFCPFFPKRYNAKKKYNLTIKDIPLNILQELERLGAERRRSIYYAWDNSIV